MDKNKPTGMPGMGLQMPGGSSQSDTESRLADLESRVSALEDLMKTLGGGAGGGTGSPVPPVGQ